MNLTNKLTACIALGLGMATGFLNNMQAGAVGGVKETVERVRSHGSDVYHVAFRGSQRAAILVSGDGDTDLDLYVYDEKGHLVASDSDMSDTCLATWVPKWTGVFRIEVRNRGGVYNRYIMKTN